MGIVIDFSEIEEAKNCKFIKREEYEIQPLLKLAHTNNEFFSFLIENNMNRYLFGFISKIKNLDLETLTFNESSLNSNKLKEICKESFIKKYECKSCGHLIFRKYLRDIENLNEEEFEIECPKCGKLNKFSFRELDDDFNIQKHDLIKYLDYLVELEIFSKKLVATCEKCTKREEVYDNTLNLICSCGNRREVKFEYTSNFDFLIKDGYWFEWYVYNLCHYHYSQAYPNYTCEYYLDNKKNRM